MENSMISKSEQFSSDVKSIGAIIMLTREIEHVQKHIDKLSRDRDMRIRALEEKKRQLRGAAAGGLSLVLMERQIQDLTQGGYETVLEEIVRLKAEAVRDKKQFDIFTETLTIMDREVSRIQADHDIAVTELRSRRENLRIKLQSLLDIEEIILTLDTNLHEATDKYNAYVTDLANERALLQQRTDLSEEELAAEITARDEVALEVERKFRQEVELTHIQKADMEVESVAILGNVLKEMKEMYVCGTEDFLEEINRLEDLKAKTSASKLAAINSAISYYRARITDEKYRLDMNVQDKINMFLQRRGFRPTADMIGNTDYSAVPQPPQSSSERILTRVEAKQTGILDALDRELVESRGLRWLPAERVLTQDGRLLSKKEAQDQGLLEVYDLEAMLFADDSIRSDLSSRDSDFVSEDGHYLKKFLGLPLTLALAEIAAIQPRDPIHYLGHWLFKFRYNQELDQCQRQEVQQLTDIRNQIAKEKWKRFVEEEALHAVLEVVSRAELQAERNVEDRELLEQEEAMRQEDREEILEEEEARDTLGEYTGPPANPRTR